MSEHYIEICANCGCVIGQCRCADKDKNIRYSLCDKCKGELPDGEYFKTVFQKLPLSEMIELTWGELNKSRFDAKLNAIFTAGYAAGLVHQARVDRKKVEKLRWFSVEGHECAAVDFQELLAALAAVAPEVK